MKRVDTEIFQRTVENPDDYQAPVLVPWPGEQSVTPENGLLRSHIDDRTTGTNNEDCDPVELSDTPSLPDLTVPSTSIPGKADTAKILPFQRPPRHRHTRYRYPDTDAVDKILDIVLGAEAIILVCLAIWYLKTANKS
jgi:hypothetical protein